MREGVVVRSNILKKSSAAVDKGADKENRNRMDAGLLQPITLKGLCKHQKRTDATKTGRRQVSFFQEETMSVATGQIEHKALRTRESCASVTRETAGGGCAFTSGASVGPASPSKPDTQSSSSARPVAATAVLGAAACARGGAAVAGFNTDDGPAGASSCATTVLQQAAITVAKQNFKRGAPAAADSRPRSPLLS